MNIYIKKVKDSKGREKEWIWINYTINSKRFRKPLELENKIIMNGIPNQPILVKTGIYRPISIAKKT